MISSNSITAQWWQIQLGQFGDIVENVDDINQALNILLSTPKGADPHRPTFGTDIMSYIDYPVTSAIPNIIREVVDAIAQWEPRINITNVTAQINYAQVFIYISWKFAGDTTISQTQVVLQ